MQIEIKDCPQLKESITVLRPVIELFFLRLAVKTLTPLFPDLFHDLSAALNGFGEFIHPVVGPAGHDDGPRVEIILAGPHIRWRRGAKGVCAQT